MSDERYKRERLTFQKLPKKGTKIVMSVASKGQFWIYTISLLIVWTIVSTTAFNNDSNFKNQLSLPSGLEEDELKNTAICKTLCKQCGCLGFYCGEECICECNKDHSDTECISEIQTNAQNLNVPFEILIQGPTANHFVRNALQFEQNQERRLYGYRNKRSTITVYKPHKNKHNVQEKPSCEKKTSIKEILNVGKILKERQKRSSNNFDWFTDLRNTLLRPAPLGGYKSKTEETKIQPASTKRSAASSNSFDSSWFLDHTANILTPAPLTKRGKSKFANDDYNENNVESSLETINTQKFQQSDNKFDNDYADNSEMDTKDSKELKNGKSENKFSFLPQETNEEESHEAQNGGGMFSRLFKNDDLNRNDDTMKFLSEERKFQESKESQETYNGRKYSRLYKDDLSKAEDDEEIFLPEEEEEKVEQVNNKKKSDKLQGNQNNPPRSFNSDLSTSQFYLPTKVKKAFRIPWFKPVKFFENVKRVMNT